MRRLVEVLLLSCVCAACARTPPAPAPAPAPVPTPDARPMPPPAPALTPPSAPTAEVALLPPPVTADASLFDLPAALSDQDGHAQGLDTWRGQPTLISLFYASCPQACPLLITNIQYVEAGLTPSQRANLRVLLVSFDPDDKPPLLRKVVKRHGLDTRRWRLTSTDPDTVRDIAAVLGVAYRKLDDGSYNHASLITLLDAQGHLVTQQDGMVRSRDAMIEAIGALAPSNAPASDPRVH